MFQIKIVLIYKVKYVIRLGSFRFLWATRGREDGGRRMEEVGGTREAQGRGRLRTEGGGPRE